MLGTLGTQEHQRILPDLEHVYLARRQVLYEAGALITHVYFPIDCVLSLLTVSGGEAVETGVVGSEGLVGLPVFLGVAVSYEEVVCQVPGAAWRMPVNAFRAAIVRGGALHAQLLRYTLARTVMAARLAACNGLHRVEQRCARWVLMMRDRVPSSNAHFLLIQEFLGRMLGVRRPTVNAVLGQFERAGLLHRTGTMIAVADAAGLEARACACYRLLNEEVAELLGAAPDGGRGGGLGYHRSVGPNVERERMIDER